MPVSALPCRSSFFLFSMLVSGCAGGWFVPAQAAEPRPVPVPQSFDGGMPKSDKPFAVVGDEIITGDAFRAAVAQGARQKFYHGAIPEGGMARFQREVGQSLVDRLLLLQEASKRGIKPDAEEVAKVIAGYEKRYASAPRWQAEREKMLPGLTRELEAQSQLKQLELQVRTLPEPTIEVVQAYYDAHPDKFTEPVNQRLSLILLKVASSAGGDAWKEAQAEAVRLVEKLRGGADFAELARIHSGDLSASAGGVMDNTHAGTLSPEVEQLLEKMQPGEISDPILVLEGVAIFRLEGRTAPTKVSFDRARERAQGLLMREQSESAWEAFKQQLRQQSQVLVHEAEYYLPLVPTGAGQEKK
ncbi:MAG: peptidylprolyl isomerase [Magnetococcus sp. YQC-3]